MKKMSFLALLIVLLPAMVFAQEKVEAPVWNVGDKWVFDREEPMEVIGCDAKWYSLKFSGGIFPKDASGIAILERSTLNVKYMLEKEQRKEYKGLRKRILNFPLTLGKQWKDMCQMDIKSYVGHTVAVEYTETYRILEEEETEVGMGKLKAIKLEYKLESSGRGILGWTPQGESKAWYWYSPKVKNFVKCQYEKAYSEAQYQKTGLRENWKLVSYELIK